MLGIPEMIWTWATTTLSPASVILFLATVLFGGFLFWSFKELRKSDLRYVEESKKNSNDRIDSLTAKVERQKLKIESDNQLISDLRIHVVKLEHTVQAQQELIEAQRKRTEALEQIISNILPLYNKMLAGDGNASDSSPN